MTHPDIEFEKFLKEEANKLFKALPTDGLQGEDDGLGREHLPQSAFGRDMDRPLAQEDVEFDILNPPTDFNDNALQEGTIPLAVAGDGRQPGIYNPVVYDNPAKACVGTDVPKLPFQDTYDDYLAVLDKPFAQFNSFKHGPQIPIDNQAVPYFVRESSPSGFANAFVASGDQSEAWSRALRHPTVPFDVQSIRQDFPILSERVNGKQLVWLDNAATTQKPQAVIDRIVRFYKSENSNIHRAAHELAARATDAYEEARNIIKDFLNAASSNEIIFTRGTTESINLVANSWGEQELSGDDEIIISHLEHHANIVPWQQLAKKKGFKIRVIPVDDDGNLLIDEYVKLLSPKTKLVSFTQVSNALGTITPAKTIIDLAHSVGAKVLLDGAQSVSHIAVDLQALDADFFVFSGHKIFGPTGIGVLYGKEALLNSMPPYQSGGNMIRNVSFEGTEFHDAPNRFEAGTGNIADAVGLGAAIRYVQGVGIDHIFDYEHQLLTYATSLLKQIGGVKLIGTAREKTSVLSFTLDGYANDDVGKALNEVGIAVRTGHHCAQPILRRLGYESSVRPSLAFYNTHQEIDLLAQTIERLAWRTKRYY